MLEFFKKFDEIFELRNNLLYKKIAFKDISRLFKSERTAYAKKYLTDQV